MVTLTKKASSRASDEETMERLTCELAEQLQHDFSDRDTLYADIDDTLFSNFPIEVPEAYRKTALEVRAPLALHIAQNVSAALSVNAPSMSFRPVGFGDVYQENSTRRERFFEASWQRQEQEARRQLFRLFMWSLAVKGEGILKTCERQSVWNTYADESEEYAKQLEQDGLDQHAQDMAYDAHTENLKLKLPYPIATTDVPPETFYYTLNENGMTSVVEIKDVPYLEALERFGTGIDSSGNVVPPTTWSGVDPRAAQLARAEWAHVMKSAGSTNLRCIEAWDESVQVICLQGPNQRSRGNDKATLCRVTRHSYGDPYLHTLRGPYFHALGITTASRLPEHAGLSVLYGYLQLFRLIDSLLTVQGNAAYLTGFPTWKQTQPPGTIPGLPGPPYGSDGREQAAAQRLEPGKLYPFDVSPIDQPQSGQDASKLLQNIQALVERAMPAAFSGAVGADQSGYALNQAAYLAGLAFNPIVSNAEVALGERTGFESWLIENRIGESVYAWGEQEGKKGGRGAGQIKGSWLKISPDDLDGVHRYSVKLSPSTPSNEIIQIRSIGEKMQLKLITYEDAVAEAGGNPDEVEQSWLLHDLKQSPEVQQALKDQVFQKLGTIQAKKMNAPGMPSVAEMTGMPPGASPAGPPTGVPGTPGTPPSGNLGGMPGNPVPMPGQGLPIAPPPPHPGVGMPPGGIPGVGVVPNPPPNSLPLVPGGGR